MFFFYSFSTRFEKNGRVKPDGKGPVDIWQVRVRVGGVDAEQVSPTPPENDRFLLESVVFN